MAITAVSSWNELAVFTVTTAASQPSGDILRLRKRFVRHRDEESRLFFARRQTRLNQQREVWLAVSFNDCILHWNADPAVTFWARTLTFWQFPLLSCRYTDTFLYLFSSNVCISNSCYCRNHVHTMLLKEGNGDLQTLICILVARSRWCSTLSNPVPWQNWMADYLGYTLWMKTLFRGWPVMVHDTHTRRRQQCCQRSSLTQWCNARYHTAGSGFNSASGKIFTNFILTFYSSVFTVICSVFAKDHLVVLM